ncbi:unnamed protein product [Gongylonema pulchrum]|uniref:Uncharacterized protein n=1 Tax=Gongylonema pulchrum TaxID=637853 RepID=A0A183DX10_9BILA|nr:unnamed protein product [Gongylonema pulchrum]
MQVDEYGNIHEDLFVADENCAADSKTEAVKPKKDEADSYPAEVDRFGTAAAPQAVEPEPVYIESYYNASDLHNWNIY